MITNLERKKIRKSLGANYSSDVLQILCQRGVVNQLGNAHNSEYIIKVFNGKRNNEDVESAIYELVKREKAAKRKRKEILKQ